MDGNFSELQPRAPGVRAFSQARQPGFGDCAPSGRVRLDALAGWLQDVAYADVRDAGLEQAAVWVVRRTRIRVNRFPRFGERFSLTTFCSGLGRMWAERRTDIVAEGAEGAEGADSASGAEGGEGGEGAERSGIADVQAISLWVHLDSQSWRPSRLTEDEIAAYNGAPARRVSARLRHPLPGTLSGGQPWTFRATECDIADHINNAAYWLPLEEELLAGPDPERLDVELEYRAPAQPGVKRVLRDGHRRWIIGDESELHASIVLAGTRGDDGA